jgi:hypothetical protein
LVPKPGVGSGFVDNRYIAREILAYDVKGVRHYPIRVGRKLAMSDAVGVGIPLFDLITAEDRHPQLATEFLG